VVDAQRGQLLVRSIQAHEEATERDVTFAVGLSAHRIKIAGLNELNLHAPAFLALLKAVYLSVAHIVVHIGES
jgi:hypothetical protein